MLLLQFLNFAPPKIFSNKITVNPNKSYSITIPPKKTDAIPNI